MLYQLPPGWKLDLGRLEHFLQVLPRGIRHVVEFREPSWYADDVLRLLEAHRVALCLHDMSGSATGRQRVGPFIYVYAYFNHDVGGHVPRDAVILRRLLVGEQRNEHEDLEEASDEQ